MSNIEGALSGVKVVSCSTAQAGTVPYMLMADLGAEVIKIEVPGSGDGSRRAGAIKKGLSSFFETNNRGVKSLTLNLKAAEGKQILHELIKRADIFGQNFRPGAAERNGFGYDPIFIPNGYKRTFAEMNKSYKYKIDHRARAFKKIKRFF